ncbi:MULTISPECIES: DNA-methyltransferase [Bacillus subtilis group]|uniref:DNA-methyltransferase n=1 Tax=Bacillus subtilis group TaxID=653685 RepID=UPI001E48F8AB|nr:MULTISPECIES: site-specific DNA-methyltransferase [Bacillus subtilis group]
MDNCSIDLTVTSPPYDDLRNYNGYSFNFKKTAEELYRITKKGGVVVWVVGDKTHKGSESGTSFKQALFFKEIGFNLHDTMIYRKENPLPQNHNRYEQEFEYMFVFSKGKPNVFNPRKEACRTAGMKYDYSKRGGVASIEESNPAVRKKSVCLVTKDEKTKGNIWSYLVGMYKSTSDKIAFQHPAIFPEKLAEDHILSWSKEGDIVFDPFMGSGTTAKMAALNNRKYIGTEISKEYCEIANKRLSGYIKV